MPPNDLPEMNAETYLGDGVYVSFDGFSVWFRAPRDGGGHLVAIEPHVYRKLTEWLAFYPRALAHLKGER